VQGQHENEEDRSARQYKNPGHALAGPGLSDFTTRIREVDASRTPGQDRSEPEAREVGAPLSRNGQDCSACGRVAIPVTQVNVGAVLSHPKSRTACCWGSEEEVEDSEQSTGQMKCRAVCPRYATSEDRVRKGNEQPTEGEAPEHDTTGWLVHGADGCARRLGLSSSLRDAVANRSSSRLMPTSSPGSRTFALRDVLFDFGDEPLTSWG